MRFNLKTLAILGAVGVVEVLGAGASQADAGWGRGRGPFGPRPFRGGYGVVYAPPVLVAPAPVVVTRPRYIYTPPTIIQTDLCPARPAGGNAGDPAGSGGGAAGRAAARL